MRCSRATGEGDEVKKKKNRVREGKTKLNGRKNNKRRERKKKSAKCPAPQTKEKSPTSIKKMGTRASIKNKDEGKPKKEDKASLRQKSQERKKEDREITAQKKIGTPRDKVCWGDPRGMMAKQNVECNEKGGP